MHCSPSIGRLFSQAALSLLAVTIKWLTVTMTSKASCTPPTQRKESTTGRSWGLCWVNLKEAHLPTRSACWSRASRPGISKTSSITTRWWNLFDRGKSRWRKMSWGILSQEHFKTWRRLLLALSAILSQAWSSHSLQGNNYRRKASRGLKWLSSQTKSMNSQRNSVAWARARVKGWVSRAPQTPKES